jgi:hypothetical protein
MAFLLNFDKNISYFTVRHMSTDSRQRLTFFRFLQH